MERMAPVKHKILVLSGKGGVGKSTFSAQLSFALADTDYQVGLPDIDICGMLGLEWQDIHQSNLGWFPIYLEGSDFVHRLRCMKCALGHVISRTPVRAYVPRSNGPCCIHGAWPMTRSDARLLHERQCSKTFPILNQTSGSYLLGSCSPTLTRLVIWRRPCKKGLIKQFLKGVHWGELDYLVVDAPPGTSDEHISIVQFLQATGIDGVIIVTTPQQVSLIDVRKEI